MANTIVLKRTPAALYGRSPTGAEDARDEFWNQAGANDADQAGIRAGGAFAAGEAANAQTRGPMATENVQLANQAASGAGGHQQGAMGLARSMAMGQSPSEGAYQLQAGLDMGSQMQASMGRSARGGAALATGQANAQANTSNLQQNAFSQAGALRAREMAAGRGLYGSLAGQASEQDQARAGMANDMAQGNARRNDAYGLGAGAAQAGFADLGNQQSGQDLGYYQGGMNPINQQSDMYQQGQSWYANNQKTKVANNTQE